MNSIGQLQLYPCKNRSIKGSKCDSPSQCHLCRHDPLPLHHQQAVGAATVPPSTQLLVALQTRDDPVVTAAGTLGGPEEAARGGCRWLLGGERKADFGVLRRRGSAKGDPHLRLLSAAHPASTTQKGSYYKTFRSLRTHN